MQLKRLYIQDYKILKDFTIEFPFDLKKYISVFIGVNGSGKSTILEVLAQIFSSAWLNEKAKFGFELEYSLRHEEELEKTSMAGRHSVGNYHTAYILVKLSAAKAGDSIQVRAESDMEKPLYEGEVTEKHNMRIALADKRPKAFSVLPDSVIVYYSGLSEIMQNISVPHNKVLSESYRKGDTSVSREFFYFEPAHFGIILMSLLSYEFGDIPGFLREKAKIAGMQSITIRLKKPEWANDSIQNFWGAKGKVRNFLDYLDENSATGDDLQYPDNSKGIGNIVIQMWQEEAIIITIVTQQKLFQIREYLAEERNLFEILHIMLIDGMLDDISFSLLKEDGTGMPAKCFSVLSEGEQQSITIRGMTELLAEKNTLFLLDEPDTYLHPKWQRRFITEIEETVTSTFEADNTFVIATHSPQLLSNAKSDLTFVKIIENGALVENTPKYYGREISTILYELMGVEERNKKIREEISQLYTLIEEEEIKKAEKLLKRLQELIGEDDTELKRAEIQIGYLKEEL